MTRREATACVVGIRERPQGGGADDVAFPIGCTRCGRQWASRSRAAGALWTEAWRAEARADQAARDARALSAAAAAPPSASESDDDSAYREG